MKCPFCAHPESKVVDSRPADEGSSIRRRRECLACHDKTKLMGSMLKACEKRSVPTDTLERIADEIEQTLQNELMREIPSTQIGELVMEKLRNVDEVSYVRFASVYRQFKDINTFMEELDKLLKER